jgi:hypothetical protein
VLLPLGERQLAVNAFVIDLGLLRGPERVCLRLEPLGLCWFE